jgi:hypothetical protein
VPTGSIGEYVRDRAEEILREHGGPMHVNEIHARFLRSGLFVPGAGKPVNLIVHLRKGPGIVSPGRGMYALRGQVDADALPRPRRPRKRRRARTAKRKGA